VPGVDVPGIGATARCSQGTVSVPVLHFDKIIFKIATGALVPSSPADNAALNALPRLTELHIKVRDNPTRVANLKGKVLTFLGAQPHAVNRSRITIVDVDYAVVCGSLQYSVSQQPQWHKRRLEYRRIGGAPNDPHKRGERMAGSLSPSRHRLLRSAHHSSVL